MVFKYLQAGDDIAVLTRNFKQLGQKYNDFNGYVEDTFTDYAAHYNATIGMLSLCPSLMLKAVNVIPQGQPMGLWHNPQNSPRGLWYWISEHAHTTH